MRLNDLGERIVIIEEKRTQLKNGRVRIENLYADGFVEEASFSSDKHFSTTLLEHFIIGRRTLGNSKQDFYTGLIDDVRIYDRALSAEEVQALYNLGQ